MTIGSCPMSVTTRSATVAAPPRHVGGRRDDVRAAVQTHAALGADRRQDAQVFPVTNRAWRLFSDASRVEGGQRGVCVLLHTASVEAEAETTPLGGKSLLTAAPDASSCQDVLVVEVPKLFRRRFSLRWGRFSLKSPDPVS
jgi:hypothetical protein